MRRARARSFTLIELLVVVSIIAILAAMLLPALSSARRRVGMSICQNNERQMAMALFAYSDDHEGVLPWSWNGPNDTLTYGTVGDPWTGYGCTNWALLLFPYVKDLRLYNCPNFGGEIKKRERDWAAVQGFSGVEHPLYYTYRGEPALAFMPYKANPYLGLDGWGPGALRRGGGACTTREIDFKTAPLMNKIDEAAETVFVFDAAWSWNPYSPTPGCAATLYSGPGGGDRSYTRNYPLYWYKPNIGTWHQGTLKAGDERFAYDGKTNVVFFDGHVDAVKADSGFTFEDTTDRHWRIIK